MAQMNFGVARYATVKISLSRMAFDPSGRPSDALNKAMIKLAAKYRKQPLFLSVVFKLDQQTTAGQARKLVRRLVRNIKSKTKGTAIDYGLSFTSQSQKGETK
jgi:hypothetical protein